MGATSPPLREASMRKLPRICLVIFLPAFMPAFGDGNQASATINTCVKIAPPIKIERRRDLWFGEVVVEAGLAGRVIEQFADRSGGTRAPDAPGVRTIVLNYEPWHNAEILVSGQPGACYSLTMPGNGVVQLLSQSGGGPGNPFVELLIAIQRIQNQSHWG